MTNWCKFRGGHRDSQGSGALSLWGEAEETGPVQPADEMTLEDHQAACQYPWGGLLRRQRQGLYWGASRTMSDGGYEMNQERFWLDRPGGIPLWELLKHRTQLPREVVEPLFSGPARQLPKQPGLNSLSSLLWARSWTEGLLRSLPARKVLLTCSQRPKLEPLEGKLNKAFFSSPPEKCQSHLV